MVDRRIPQVGPARQQVTVRPDVLDTFTDSFSSSISPGGVTLTFSRSLPTGEPGARVEPFETVVRLRMSREFAKLMCETVSENLRTSSPVIDQSEQGPKH